MVVFEANPIPNDVAVIITRAGQSLAGILDWRRWPAYGLDAARNPDETAKDERGFPLTQMLTWFVCIKRHQKKNWFGV